MSWAPGREDILGMLDQGELGQLIREAGDSGPAMAGRSLTAVDVAAQTPMRPHGPQIARLNPTVDWMLTNRVRPFGLNVEPANSSLS